jgi:hypothetical protein
VRAERPDDVTEQVWGEFAALRKARRAPVTPTVIAGIRREAAKAGVTLQDALQTVIERGWQSFRADWGSSNSGPARAVKTERQFLPGMYGNSNGDLV